MDRTERTIKAIAEAIARGECPPRTTPREWTNFEKQAKAVFYDLMLTVQLHDDETSPAKVGGDEREAFERDRHSDDKAVDLFASAMKKKLAEARLKGRRGWQTCRPDDLSEMLREHVDKGDPRDVANFCMFLWMLGAPISRAALSADGGERKNAERYCIVREMESSDFDNLSIRLPEQIDAYVDAIAAKAKGEA